MSKSLTLSRPVADNVRANPEDVLAAKAYLHDLGRNGDTILAHITPEEARLLDRITDGGTAA